MYSASRSKIASESFAAALLAASLATGAESARTQPARNPRDLQGTKSATRCLPAYLQDSEPESVNVAPATGMNCQL